MNETKAKKNRENKNMVLEVPSVCWFRKPFQCGRSSNITPLLISIISNFQPSSVDLEILTSAATACLFNLGERSNWFSSCVLKSRNICANCFCASSLDTQVHTLALSSKLNNDRASGHCYSFALI